MDGAVLDSFTLKHGFWEAKDLKDQLEKEIKKKLEQGYPRSNIIFQSPEKAILYQKGVRQGLNEDITDPDNLVDLLKEFFKYREPQHEEWEAAVADFSSRILEIAAAVKAIIEKERKTNKKFVASFEGFVLLCRQAINPNLSDAAVETMLIQHLLTERIFRTSYFSDYGPSSFLWISFLLSSVPPSRFAQLLFSPDTLIELLRHRKAPSFLLRAPIR